MPRSLTDTATCETGGPYTVFWLNMTRSAKGAISTCIRRIVCRSAWPSKNRTRGLVTPMITATWNRNSYDELPSGVRRPLLLAGRCQSLFRALLILVQPLPLPQGSREFGARCGARWTGGSLSTAGAGRGLCTPSGAHRTRHAEGGHAAKAGMDQQTTGPVWYPAANELF